MANPLSTYNPRYLLVFAFTSNYYVASEDIYLNLNLLWPEATAVDWPDTGSVQWPDLEGGQFFKGRLMNEPSINAESSGGRELPSDITLKLKNGDGWLNTIEQAEDIIGSEVFCYYYEPFETGAKVRAKYRWTVEDYSPLPEAEIRLKVFEHKALKNPIPPRVYKTDDWRTTGDGAPADVDDSTIYNPDTNLGAGYPIGFGHCKKVPAVYVLADTVSDYYYYIFSHGTTYSNNTNKASTVVVYSQGVVVPSTEYTIYDGSQASPFPGFAYIRFNAERRDSNGNPAVITIDFYGIENDAGNVERNPINIIKLICENTTWGLSLTCDETSFTTAAGQCANLLYDFALYTQRDAQDVLDDLCWGAYHAVMQDTQEGKKKIVCDVAGSSVANFGSMDGVYENVIAGDPEYGPIPRSDRIKNLYLKYRWNEWTQEYMQEITQAVHSDNATDLTVELWYCRDHSTVDRIKYFNWKLQSLGNRLLTFTAGMQGRDIKRGDVITVTYRWPQTTDTGTLIELCDTTFKVHNISNSLTQYQFECQLYSASIHAYVAGTLPTDEHSEDLPDYSNTPPDPPTNLSITETITQSSDGTTVSFLTMSADQPNSLNFASVQFGFRKSGGNYVWFDGDDADEDGTWEADIEGSQVLGQIYEYAARSVNQWGKKGILYVTSAPGTAFPGDTTAPTITTLTITENVKTLKLAWTAATADDWDGVVIYRGSASPTTELTRIGGKATSWVDENPGYSEQNYRIKFKDFSGNLSAYSNNVSGTVTGVEPSKDYDTGPGVQINWTDGTITVKSDTDPVLKATNTSNNLVAFLWAGATGGINHATVGCYGAADSRLYFGCAKDAGGWAQFENLLCLFGGTDSGGTPREPSLFPLIDARVTLGIPAQRIKDINMKGIIRNYYDDTNYVAMWTDSSHGYVGTYKFGVGGGNLALMLQAKEVSVLKFDSDGIPAFQVAGAFNTGVRKTTYARQLVIKDSGGTSYYVDAFIT
jgi:hypothetical protein